MPAASIAGAAARRLADHAHPDHDRRPAVGDRHRRHGPAGALQRPRQIGPRGRGGGRHRRAAARQDRHDHDRRPPRDRVPAAVRASAKSELAEAAYLASLADETPEGRSIVALAREKYGVAAQAMPAGRGHHSVHARRRAFPGLKFGEHPDPEGRGRFDPARRSAAPAKAPPRPSCAGSPRRSPAPAARRSRSPATARCSACSTSRTSSRPACASASPSCAGWASAR